MKKNSKGTGKKPTQPAKEKREGLIILEDNNSEIGGFEEQAQSPYEGPSHALQVALAAVEAMGKKKPH